MITAREFPEVTADQACALLDLGAHGGRTWIYPVTTVHDFFVAEGFTTLQRWGTLTGWWELTPAGKAFADHLAQDYLAKWGRPYSR